MDDELPSRRPPEPRGTRSFDIDPHGRVLPSDEETRTALADRAGHFVLAPSAPDLLLAQRRPTAGGPLPPGRCALAGDVGLFPIADVVGLIHQSRHSGLLTLGSGGLERSVLFKDGEVRGAQSEAGGERIGEVAHRLGFVTAAQLEQAVAAAAGAEQLFGKVLLDLGFLSASDLWKSLHEQVASVFHGMLLAREGVFTLVEGADVDLGTPLSVNTQSLLMDGIRRIDEMSLFRERIPGPAAFLRRRQPKSPITLQPIEQKLVELVDGRRTVAEVAQSAHLGEFDATKILYHLAEAGYVELFGGPTPEPTATPAERQQAMAQAANGILREVTAAVGPSGLEPFLVGVRAFLADPASRFAPLWHAVLAGRDGSVDEESLLGNVAALRGAALAKLEPSGDATRLLLEALRELVLFYLFQAGERLPRAEDERLSLEVKRRFEALSELR